MFKEFFRKPEIKKVEEKELPKHFTPEKESPIEALAADIEEMLRKENIDEDQIPHEQINQLFRDNEEEFRKIYRQNPKELLALVRTVAEAPDELPN